MHKYFHSTFRHALLTDPFFSIKNDRTYCWIEQVTSQPASIVKIVIHLTRRVQDDFRRRVTAECNTCNTWQINLPDVREFLETSDYRDSRYFLIHRALPNIREVSRERWNLGSVTFRVLINLPTIREILWNNSASYSGHLSVVGRFTEHSEGFSKDSKPSEHLRSYTTGTYVSRTTPCIHSSHRFPEVRESTRIIVSSGTKKYMGLAKSTILLILVQCEHTFFESYFVTVKKYLEE